MNISPTTIDAVKATVPVLKRHGHTVIINFYDTLFERYPHFRPYFNMDRHRGGASKQDGVPSQVAALARAVVAYAAHIENITPIMPIVEGICHKHVSRGVEPHQYDAIGECLLHAMAQTLGPVAIPSVMAAWTEAYGFLAKTFQDAEARIKAELAEKADFGGFIDMTVQSTTVHGDEKHIVFARKESREVGEYGKGQFVAVRVKIGHGEETTTTLKLIPGEQGKITVKSGISNEKATTAVRGLCVGDIVPVSLPCGKIQV